MPPELRAPLAVVAVLLPGLMAWILGRPLEGKSAAPDLAERVHRWRRWIGRVVGFSLAVLPFAAGILSAPLILLSLLGVAAGSYPLRRALFRETWGLAGYLAWVVRRSVALGGFWALLLAAPFLVEAWPYRPAVAGAALFVVLVAWLFLWRRLLSLALDLRPLEDPELSKGLAAVTTAAGLTSPELLAGGPETGLWPNAMALPAGKGPGAVVVSRTLLSRLSPPQLLAIVSHELAHLVDGKAARGRSAAVLVLVYLATAVPALLKVEAPNVLTWFNALWLPALFLLAVAGTARGRRHEADCDAKAAAWCGDPEALAGALEVVYGLALLPRRGTESFGSMWMSTHPPLEDRLRALRGLPPDEDPGRRPDSVAWLVLVRLLALGAGVAAFLLPGFAVGVTTTALAVLLAAEAAPLAALGGTALGWSVFAEGTRYLAPDDAVRLPQVRWLMLGVGLIALGLSILRLARRPERRGAALTAAASAAGLVTAISLAGLLWVAPLGALRVHQEARTRPALPAGLLGLSAALLAAASPAKRVLFLAGVAAALSVSLPVFLRGETFLRAFGRDPLLPASAPARAARRLEARVVSRTDVEMLADELEASSSGVLLISASIGSDSRHLLALRPGGGRYELAARAARLLPDGRLLALVDSGETAELWLLPAPGHVEGHDETPAPPLERHLVPPVRDPRLEMDPRSGRCTLVGADPESDERVIVEGPEVGPLPGDDEAPPVTAVLTRELEERTVLGRWPSILLGQPRPLAISRIGFHQGSRLLNATVRTVLPVGIVPGGNALFSFDGFSSHVFRLDAASPNSPPRHAASVRGEVRPLDAGSDGTLLLARGRTLLLVPPGPGEILEIPVELEPLAARLVPGGIAVLERQADGGSVLAVIATTMGGA